MTTPGAAGTGPDLATREAAVDAAVTLCASSEDIPDRSQLNTLLRAAIDTPSVKEVVLFVRYQAARQRGGRSEFLGRVAEAIEGAPWGRDIEAVRFFLGSLARAVMVASKSPKSTPRTRRGRDGGRG